MLIKTFALYFLCTTSAVFAAIVPNNATRSLSSFAINSGQLPHYVDQVNTDFNPWNPTVSVTGSQAIQQSSFSDSGFNASMLTALSGGGYSSASAASSLQYAFTLADLSNFSLEYDVSIPVNNNLYDAFMILKKSIPNMNPAILISKSLGSSEQSSLSIPLSPGNYEITVELSGYNDAPDQLPDSQATAIYDLNVISAPEPVGLVIFCIAGLLLKRSRDKKIVS